MSHPEAQLMCSVTLPEKGKVCWMHGVNINDGNFSLQLCFSIFLMALTGWYVKRTESRLARVYICSDWLILRSCVLPRCTLFQALPVWMELLQHKEFCCNSLGQPYTNKQPQKKYSEWVTQDRVSGATVDLPPVLQLYTTGTTFFF